MWRLAAAEEAEATEFVRFCLFPDHAHHSRECPLFTAADTLCCISSPLPRLACSPPILLLMQLHSLLVSFQSCAWPVCLLPSPRTALTASTLHCIMAAATATASPNYIHTAMLDTPTKQAPGDTDSIQSLQILNNEIQNLHVYASTFTAPTSCQPLTQPDVVCVYFFYSGRGCVENAGQHYIIDDMALLVTHPAHPLLVTAVTATLHAIELHWQLTPADTAATPQPTASLPYCQPYSTARTYKEAIKSAKTTSRTLLPPGVVPRLAIGSVQTSGPDAVAAHSHPMLEQLFMGVRGCDCVVHCDGAEAALVEAEVLHIPLGSVHGVRVEEGKLLEYLWFDFFLNQQDGDRWIATMHTDDPV